MKIILIYAILFVACLAKADVSRESDSKAYNLTCVNKVDGTISCLPVEEKKDRQPTAVTYPAPTIDQDSQNKTFFGLGIVVGVILVFAVGGIIGLMGSRSGSTPSTRPCR